jgi:hypothetical protein|tara:strand:- start:28 stop:255 length:228 start_codon:yes stop_codon:yes gene_type:complete
MYKNNYHKQKLYYDDKDKKKISQTYNLNTKSAVDINILLNRVKLEEKNEVKKKIIFYSFATLALSLFGAFIVIIK